MRTEAQVTLNEKSVVIDMGEMNIMFAAPTGIDTGSLDVLLFVKGQTIYATVSAKTIVGALKALGTSHDRRKVYKEGRDRWESSMQQREPLS